MNVVAEPRSRLAIAGIVRKLRELIGLENELYFPIVRFIEWILANPDNGIDLEIVDPREMADMYGNTSPGGNIMRIRSDVYERAIHGSERDRFTLCHEVGHYFLHQPESISHARGKSPIYMDPEWQANAFAGELLAPSYLIKDLTISEIAEKCGISKKAAQIQYSIIHQ